MFENKKYITIAGLDKMHSDGRIISYSMRTASYAQHMERIGDDGKVILVYDPQIIINIQTRYGEHLEIHAVKKKKTIRICKLFVNSIEIKRTIGLF